MIFEYCHLEFNGLRKASHCGALPSQLGGDSSSDKLSSLVKVVEELSRCDHEAGVCEAFIEVGSYTGEAGRLRRPFVPGMLPALWSRLRQMC